MKQLILFAAAAIAFTACNNEDLYDEDPVALQISATIENVSNTRASETSWKDNDAIGISLDDVYTNVKYITENGDGKFTGSTMYLLNKRVPVTLSAYYPFAGGEGSAPGSDGIITYTTSSEYQTSEHQVEFDFLYDKKTNVIGDVDPEVNFTFSHKMCKLTFRFNNGDGANAIRIASYRIDGLTLAGSFNTITGECAADENAASAALFMELTGETDGKFLSPLIIFPQAVADKDITLTLTDSDGQIYSTTLNFGVGEEEITSGNNYQFTIKVNKTGLKLEESTIAPWVSKNLSGDAGSINPKK